ncbi:MAG: phosphate ABC transporter permease subunit PstC [Actinobacteria bacterium]|nr:phosphate ABC transporter permease subunit PstC [Actinomycetota bacterium]
MNIQDLARSKIDKFNFAVNRRNSRTRKRWYEALIKYALLVSALISIATTLGIIITLLIETVAFFKEVPILKFLTDTRWTPLFKSKHFGILPLFSGTMQIAIESAVVGLPIGLLSAVYLSEYAPSTIRKILKPMLEVLAGIPTVVYGYFALTFITPIIKRIFPQTMVFNAASASIVVGIMVIPMISSLSEDAMHAVPNSLREAAYSLGATKLEVTTRVVMPTAISGIIASFILAVSRAIGETMIVVIAAGQMPTLTWNPLKAVETMTAYIVQVSLGDTPYGSLEFKTIFAVGMSLFVITLVMNVLSLWVVRKFKKI